MNCKYFANTARNGDSQRAHVFAVSAECLRGLFNQLRIRHGLLRQGTKKSLTRTERRLEHPLSATSSVH